MERESGHHLKEKEEATQVQYTPSLGLVVLSLKVPIERGLCSTTAMSRRRSSATQETQLPVSLLLLSVSSEKRLGEAEPAAAGDLKHVPPLLFPPGPLGGQFIPLKLSCWWVSKVPPMSQLQGQRTEEEGGRAEDHERGPVAVLLSFTFLLLTEDSLEAWWAEAALVLIAGAPVLAQQELVVADICWGRKKGRSHWVRVQPSPACIPSSEPLP